jgi:hypothetical protein
MSDSNVKDNDYVPEDDTDEGCSGDDDMDFDSKEVELISHNDFNFSQ